MKVRLSVLILLIFLAGLVGIGVGWTARGVAGYDGCLDRIDYDKSLYHLCDHKAPSPQNSN